MKKVVYCFVLIQILQFVSTDVFAQSNATYTKDIAEIIYKNCTSCHRPGEIAPMSFTSYEEIKSWGTTIKYVTNSGYMPPWPPDKDYSHFQQERGLSQAEIDLIANWVDNGMPYGDAAEEPELPIYPTGSQIGEPDLVLQMSEVYTHKGTGSDDYRVFVIPTNLTEDKQLAALELRPGNPKIVHHALFSYDTTGEARQLDAADSEYGYDGFGGFGINSAFTNQYPGYVPGQKPFIYPTGLGKVIPKNADILMQVHYAPVPVDEEDQSTINIFFKQEQVERQVSEFIMLPFAFSGTTLDKPFFIPANQVTTFHGTFTTPIDVSIISISPHMHLLGQSWEVYLEAPDGTITNLIKVPDWDFNWQGGYNFQKFIVAKAGTKVHAIASYDNTSNNPVNPNSPPQLMTWGEKTSDEMYYLPISYVPYKAGDENVVFDNGTSTGLEDAMVDLGENTLLDPFPNPTSTILNVHFTLATSQRACLTLLNSAGQQVMTQANNKIHYSGRHEYQFDIAPLADGSYSVVLTTDKGVNIAKQVLLKH